MRNTKGKPIPPSIKKERGFSTIRSFRKEDVLNSLSRTTWTPFTKLCLLLKADTKKKVQDLMVLIQSLFIERKIIRNKVGDTIELKRID